MWNNSCTIVNRYPETFIQLPVVFQYSLKISKTTYPIYYNSVSAAIAKCQRLATAVTKIAENGNSDFFSGKKDGRGGNEV